MKVVVTGAKGYIGTHVVRCLSSQMKVDVVGVDIDTIDILTEASNSELFAKLGSPDAIVHLAWKDGFKHNSKAHLDNVGAHYNFLVNMIESGCKNITVMGSMHEVGYYEGCISDVTPPPCEPMSPYGIAKNALRQAMFAYVRGKDVSFKWLRGYYITGDDLKGASIFAKICQMEAAGQKSFPFTDGKTQYDFVDIDNLAKMISAAGLALGTQEIINVCSGVPVTLKDRVELFLKEKGFAIRPEYGKFPTRPYDSPVIYGSNDKITKLLKQFP